MEYTKSQSIGGLSLRKLWKTATGVFVTFTDNVQEICLSDGCVDFFDVFAGGVLELHYGYGFLEMRLRYWYNGAGWAAYDIGD